MIPYNCVDDKQDPVIRNELLQILGKQKWTSFRCVQFKQPFAKLEKNKTTLVNYVAMMSISLVSMIVFIFPFEGPSNYTVPIIILWTIVNLLFTWTALKSPGYVEKSSKISFLRLNQYFKPSFLCPKCEIIRPQDSNHCHYCNKCVDRFDHHCPFADTCIGHNNHNQFFMLIIAMWIYLLYIIIVLVINVDAVNA